MGRMKKEHKIITDYKLTLTYTCPVTNLPVNIDDCDIICHESPCDGGSWIYITLPPTCPSCGQKHNDIKWSTW